MFELTQDTYTKDEVQGLLQSETDKVRTSYVQKLKAAEAERDKLKPAEKTEQEKALEQREAELSRKEREFACKMAGVDPAFADLLRDDADLTRLGELLKAGTGYQPNEHPHTGSMSRSDFDSLSYAQQVDLYQKNPNIFESLV